jgi:prefoldin subunit 5
MDVDVLHLQRVIRTLETRVSILLDRKRELEAALADTNIELDDLLHARQTMQAGVAAVQENREAPEIQRH